MQIFWVIVDLGEMSKNGYSTLRRTAELQPHHKMQFSMIPKIPILWVGS